jgi:putative aldouronate transport system permease protein
MRESLPKKFFDYINILILLSLTLICIIPFINTLALSFSSNYYVSAGLVTFWPKDFTLSSYKYLLERDAFWRAFLISTIRLILGTAINLVMILLTAYPLSKESSRFQLRTVYIWFFFVTMLISGGMIPNYLLITRLGMRNTIWALVLPGALPIFNLVLMINFFRQIPKEMEEAALIDGASQFTTMVRIYIPCSMAAIATISLFCMVSHWNAWFDGMIYMNNANMRPLQTYLRTVIINMDMSEMSGDDVELLQNLSDRALRGAQILIAMLPILSVYPFLQRYFVKGIVLGSPESVQKIR